MPVKRLEPGVRFSAAVVHGKTVYLAGLTADNPVPSTKKQTEQILKKIDRLLKLAGTSKKNLLSANCWVTDIRNWAEMNEAWDAWIDKNNMPVRATVEAKLANPKLLVEIMVQAALPD
jgi:enamine deaminase RidA (YjgF/YER057c/UK114 family)